MMQASPFFVEGTAFSKQAPAIIGKATAHAKEVAKRFEKGGWHRLRTSIHKNKSPKNLVMLRN